MSSTRWLTARWGNFTGRWQTRFTEGTEAAVATAGLFRTEPNAAATTTAAACAAATTPSCAGRDLITLGKSGNYWQHDFIVFRPDLCNPLRDQRWWFVTAAST